MQSGLFYGITTKAIFAERAGLFYPSINWCSIMAIADELNVKEFHVQVPSCDETAIYFLKGAVSNWDLKNIFWGMMQFMVIQLSGLILIFILPQIILCLPNQVCGS